MSAPSQRVTVPAGFFTASARPKRAGTDPAHRRETNGVAVTNTPEVRHGISVVPADWLTWLRLSSTPAVADERESQRMHPLRGGVVIDPAAWPSDHKARIYVPWGADGPAYVGQTSQPLAARIRGHFGTQTTPDQQLKAGTWHFVVSAAFDNLTASELDALESHAARWLLPHHQRQGRRYPRPPR